VIVFICFGALVILGAFNVRRQREHDESRERIARIHVERAKHEAAKAVAELEAFKVANPPAKRGRPAKTPEAEIKP
jgi:Flp pilus assembly protein TadB